MKKFVSLIAAALITCIATLSNAKQTRIDLMCSWNDGDIENIFVIFNESQVLDTNLVRNTQEWDDSLDYFKSSCSISDRFVKCTEAFVMFEGRARGDVNVKLSRTTSLLLV